MTIRAWYMDDDTETDQREPHKTNPVQWVSKEVLDELGVLSWEGLDGTGDDPTLKKIREERGYNYCDQICCCPDKLPNYEQKLKSFYEEHIHYDEEIRYFTDGTGYFDVRDQQDRWIRIEVSKGVLLILPEGIYHRFTLDTNNYLGALRFFVGEPVWTPYNRTDITEENPSRQKYISTFVEPSVLSKKVRAERSGANNDSAADAVTAVNGVDTAVPVTVFEAVAEAAATV